MKATIHVNQAPHQLKAGAAMKAGLGRHGIAVSYADYDDPCLCDFAVIWGAPSKHPRVAQTAPHLLVMERGHLPNRMVYTSCGWDGLARRGRYPRAMDGGRRWRETWGALLQPWREGGEYVLFIGQVSGDSALVKLGCDFEVWAQRKVDTLALSGSPYPVRFRPHPLADKSWCPRGALSFRVSLQEDLAGAALCVTYNSTAGVEAVLAGVPTVTFDEGAMAWEVTSHRLADLIRPDRDTWAYDLAWTSYTVEEITNGMAWEQLASIIEVSCPSA